MEPLINKYIDPMVDYGFKRIFKESGKKQLIIRPINAVFGLDIVDVDIRDSEQLGLTENERKASYDLFCTTADGSTFIIEVQLASQQYFMERAIFYSSLTIAHQAERGEWNFNVQPVFFLGLLNFDLRHLDPSMANPDQFIHRFSLREDSTHEQMSRALRFAFMEIERFNKPKEECITFEDRFLYMMKNLPTFVEKPELFWDDPYFEELMEEAEFANMTEEQRWKYALAMKQKWDYKNTIDYAHDQGREEGMAEGREEGREEGIKQTAKNLKSLGVSDEMIAKATGLTLDQIQAL